MSGAKPACAIEETARLCDLVEDAVRKEIPPAQLDNILDNIGLPYSQMNTLHMTSGAIGSFDADIMVTLKENHNPTANYIRDLRRDLPEQFPGSTFYFLPADIVTQILNFGLPSPIDVQIEGSDAAASHEIAGENSRSTSADSGPGRPARAAAVRLPDAECLGRPDQGGGGRVLAAKRATSVLNTLSGSLQTTPMFFLNWKNGVAYNLVAQTPQYRVDSLQDLQNIPITSPGRLPPASSRMSRRSITAARWPPCRITTSGA